MAVEDDNGFIKPRATAFYVVIPFSYDRKQGRGYLVTAKHNVFKLHGRRVYVSINRGTIGGDRRADWLPFEVDRWFEHPTDAAADVAVADWRPSIEHQTSYMGILTDAFIEGSPETGPPFVLREGLETATVGLFAYHAGTDRHTPIVRAGNCAALPHDRVSTHMGEAQAILIEARSVGGLSGSPVFVREEIYQGLQRYPLVGLIQGHFDWKDEVKAPEWQSIHTGIAVVTPSIKIIEVLRSPDCAATRSEFACIF